MLDLLVLGSIYVLGFFATMTIFGMYCGHRSTPVNFVLALIWPIGLIVTLLEL